MDWAVELARSIMQPHGGITPEAEDALAAELRRIEAVGYTRGYSAASNAPADRTRQALGDPRIGVSLQCSDAIG